MLRNESSTQGDCYNVGMDSCVMSSRGGDPAPPGRSTCCYTLHTCMTCNEMAVSEWVIMGDVGLRVSDTHLYDL